MTKEPLISYKRKKVAIIDIVDFFKRKTIIGIPISAFRDIIFDRKGGNIFPSGKFGVNIVRFDDDRKDKIVGCICEYFTDNNNNKKLKVAKSNNIYDMCRDVKDKLGMNRDTWHDCEECYRYCLENNISRYYKK